MSLSPATSGDGKEAIPITPAIAGRIDAAGDDLRSIVRDWCTQLLAQNRARSTVSAYRSVVLSAIQECGWRTRGDLTPEALEAYLVGKRGDGTWKGVTFNRNLTCFRSFSKYLKGRTRDSNDPAAGLENAQDDSDQNERAATLAEARAIVTQAWARQRAGRCRDSAPVLQLLLMFLHGCRGGEPEKLRWKNILLEETPPRIRWTKGINKNRKEQENAIAPELEAELLRHRAAMLELAKETPVIRRRVKGGRVVERPIDPRDPEAFVLGAVLSRSAFRDLRDEAGVPAKDSRGRSFTPRSARKYFDTALTEAGVEDRLVRRLMRHAIDVPDRYFDAKLERQVAALRQLPPILGGSGQIVDNSRIGESCLTAGRADGQMCSATPMLTTSNNAIRPPALQPSMASQPVFADGRGARTRSPLEQLALASEAARLGESAISNPEMPISGLVNVDSSDLADFFAALAKLLRPGASHARDRQA